MQEQRRQEEMLRRRMQEQEEDNLDKQGSYSSLCVIRFVMSCLPSVSRPMFYEYVPSRAGTTRGLEEHRELSSAFPTLRR